MANQFQLAGVQPTKPTKFAPIYVGRWSSGIWTNRSPLRDAITSRQAEKWYGPSGDALIDGLNVEITNRLTLARRPGTVVYDDSGWDDILIFYDFHAYHGLPNTVPPAEHIHIMVDQPEALYSSTTYDPKELIWNKTAGAGQSYMQSVGNSLYFGNGIDNKKWLHEVYEWTPNGDWTLPNTPIFKTFIVDANGNIQQLMQQGISGAVEPTWGTTVPSESNDFQGSITTDGTAIWYNRGPEIENWGLAAPTGTLHPAKGISSVSWNPNTRYSLPGVVIDTNGNLQQVSTAGTSGDTEPTWATIVGNTTTDNEVVWTMIQTAASLIWQPHTGYAEGSYLVANGCLFQGSFGNHVLVKEPLQAGLWDHFPGGNGRFGYGYPLDFGTALETSSIGNMFSVTAQPLGRAHAFAWPYTNGAGTIVIEGYPFPTWGSNYQVVMLGSVTIPEAGQYNITFSHVDGGLLGIGGGAVLVSGVINDPTYNHTVSAVEGYQLMCGTNERRDSIIDDTCVVNFPTAGEYPIEIDYAYANNSPYAYFSIEFNGERPTPPPPETADSEPIWPNWSTQYAPDYPSVKEELEGQIIWKNLGPVGDFVWQAGIRFTLPNTTIIDSNGNTEAPYRTGTTGTAEPQWATGLYQLTNDAPNLIWINEGIVQSPPIGSLSTFNGGWQYAIALVNTLDQTVSNCGTLSASTNNFLGVAGINFAPGDGLGDLSKIDPQADYVAFFRTTDGGGVPFLIPGFISVGSPAEQQAVPWTISLHDYLLNGYTDTTPDEKLNNQIQGPINGQNTPPGGGAINLTFHLNRIWFSIQNIVYWTSGPDTPAGNGINGVAPLNFDTLPSKVIKIQPVGIGALVFTIDGIWLIQGAGTTSNPIQTAIPYLPNIGVLHYNAIALDGSVIGLFTTENQFLILDPTAGVVDAGYPIGNLLRQNNGIPGQSWDASKVYVTCHTQGEDHAFYVSDGVNGWYRLMPTPSPEVGYTWSPFAFINEGASSPATVGCKCVQSMEVAPGVHRLLIGPVNSGPILNRDMDVFSDNEATYPAFATIGSAVLAQPRQLAAVVFVATDSVKIGTPLILGMLFDEAYPYYKGSVEVLKHWEPDPPNILPASSSILSQRFYMDELHEKAALCRHCQMQILFSPTDSVQNELQTLSIYGGYIPED